MSKFIFLIRSMPLLCLFWLVFALSLRPIGAYDSLYTAHVGKMILAARSIPKVETISWTQAGKPWLIHQPLAEVILGILDVIGGIGLLSLSASILLGIFCILNYIFFLRIGRFHKLIAWILALFASATVSEFFIPRAQVFAQVYFVLCLILVYTNVAKPKTRRLVWALPLLYAWANSHASFFLGIYLLCSGMLISTRLNTRHIRIWAPVCLASLIATILPPIGTQGWNILARFSHDMAFLQVFIAEWAPLASDYVHFSFYAFLIFLLIATSCLQWFRHRHMLPYIHILPLVPIIALGFVSLRNIPFGTSAAFAALGLLFAHRPLSAEKPARVSTWIFVVLLIPLSFWLFANKRDVARDSAWFFPWEAATFLKAHRMEGRMFNEMALGSFLMYTVPEYQVYFDGRVEMFGCCQMREYHSLMQYKTASREEFQSAWKRLDDANSFSYALLPIQSYNPLETTTTGRIADILSDDPRWVLIYVDDKLKIFVKRDGKNDPLIQAFGMTAAILSRSTVAKPGQEELAKKELERMIRVTDSAVSRTALGVILKQTGNRNEAKVHWDRAILLNPYYGKPNVERAILAHEERDETSEEQFLLDAIRQSPYLGEAYVMLGKLYTSQQRLQDAKRIMKSGLMHNIDYISRRELISALDGLSK